MQSKNSNKKQEELFQSIIVKFILNLPSQERRQQSRLSYHAEKAWYYYLDCVLLFKDDSELSSNDKYTFFEKLRTYSPKGLHINPDVINSKLSENKPTCGAIIMNQSQTKVLVIKNKIQKFGFPKGKWNQSQKPEECAARQVYEEIGIYIHNKIQPENKIQFLGNGNVPSIFFVVKGVKETEKFKIDPKEIAEVFWMNLTDVTKYQRKFVSKSRTAWQIYQDQFSEPKLTIEQFIEFYKPKANPTNGQKEVNQQKRDNSLMSGTQDQNPFLNFKFDRQKLMRVFAK